MGSFQRDFAGVFCLGTVIRLALDKHRLIRQYFPKKLPFPPKTRSQSTFVIGGLSTRPRELIDCATPVKMYFESARFMA